MSRERRSRLDVYADILEAVKGGSKKTHIVYQANLNFKRCKKYLDNLRGNGLIKAESNPPLVWSITEEGKEFLKKYDDMRDILPR
ncbi:hypothetical protein AKJ36_00975 [candidate division MSBL1 archaeon SCGC-AAA259I07]|uniref:ArnR1-like winged helix-turn-helix domain-containing protein n=1 Tax=candidate division MSBL1 archaeon SCGC-AAA259I07 TaxID=1698266 RepID=A0A133UM48_9EURY|nr:hypothetical protein AKJ36_00975 [candidate division MSBL1 archaeon SCGC-AAA259I07]